MENEKDDLLMNKAQVCKYLGVHPITLDRRIRRHEIGFYRVGRRVLFSKSKHIIEYLTRNEVRPGEVIDNE